MRKISTADELKKLINGSGAVHRPMLIIGHSASHKIKFDWKTKGSPMKPKQIYPLVIVMSVISLIEIAMTVLYPKLSFMWERVPVLAVIVLVPFSVVGTFIFLWVKHPGHLYPPSEFGSDALSNYKLAVFSCSSYKAEEIARQHANDLRLIDGYFGFPEGTEQMSARDSSEAADGLTGTRGS